MEFSKKLLAFISVMYIATWIAIIVSLFRMGDAPGELMTILEMHSWVYGAAVACYCGKAAYENREKIKSGGKG